MLEEKPIPDLTPLEAPAKNAFGWHGILAAFGRGVVGITGWLADRVDDLGHWAGNLVRFLPFRMTRIFQTLANGAWALSTLPFTAIHVARHGGRSHFGPWARARSRQGAIRLIQLALELLDVIGAPELFAFVWRMVTHCTPLSGAEIAAAAGVLGPRAIRYQDIRIAEGGLLKWVFQRNGNRAFATFHTVNLPTAGAHARDNLPIVIHELVHVYQYERAGSRYMAEAILAQHQEGYGYGGDDGLRRSHSQGKRLRNFNREQQAQIVEDFFRSGVRSAGDSAFDHYISELRDGRI